MMKYRAHRYRFDPERPQQACPINRDGIENGVGCEAQGNSSPGENPVGVEGLEQEPDHLPKDWRQGSVDKQRMCPAPVLHERLDGIFGRQKHI